MLGKFHTEESKLKIRLAHLGRRSSEETKVKMRLRMLGENNHQWKGGFSRTDRTYINNYQKTRRHLKGISKNYRTELNKSLGFSYTKEYRKMQHQKRKYLIKNGGELTLQIIQQVYEDNIKQFGTLTCIYCLKPIPFGKDTLEHKQPLSRGGNNARENLDIACEKCNKRKKSKTVDEFKNYIQRIAKERIL